MFVFVAAVSTALIVSFLCSIFESVLLTLGHAQIEALEQKGSRAGRILKRFKREIDVPIAAILILNTAANTLGASIAGASYAENFPPSTLWIFSLTFTVSVLLLTEILPKTLGISFSDTLAAPVALAVNAMVFFLRPVIFLTQLLSRSLRRDNIPVTSIEEIRLLAALGRAEGAVGTRTAHIIEGAARLRELHAWDVMVPRNRVQFLSATRSKEENLAVVRESNHSRFPFTPGDDLDKVEGVVLTKELLFYLRDTEGPIPWETLVQPAIEVPTTISAHQMLRLFQEEKRHMALVVDEYGGFDGIVTLEDILEELVGDIQDESDADHGLVRRHAGNRITCRGIAEVRKVFTLLHLPVETEAVTLSGFITELLGAVPKTGDVVHHRKYEFRVIRASGRRAESIEITPVVAAENSDD